MERLNVCSICNSASCQEKPYETTGNLNKVVGAELSVLRHSINRIGGNVQTEDIEVIQALAYITSGIEKLEIYYREKKRR